MFQISENLRYFHSAVLVVCFRLIEELKAHLAAKEEKESSQDKNKGSGPAELRDMEEKLLRNIEELRKKDTEIQVNCSQPIPTLSD